MKGHHPDRCTLEHFACGDLSESESRSIERHLRSGCPTCQSEVDKLLVPLDEDPEVWCELIAAAPSFLVEDPTAIARTFERLEQRLATIELERAAAPDLVAELLALPWAEHLAFLDRRPDLHTLAVSDLLIEQSFEAGFGDPAGSLALAALAIEVTDRLAASHYGKAVVQDLRARAWAYLGNAHRVAGDLEGAEEALTYAENLAEDGSADPLEEARILDLKAALLADQGCLDEAAELLDLALEIYHEVRDPSRYGQAMVHKGIVLGNAGRPKEAIPLIEEGLRWLEPPREPHLPHIGTYHLAGFLADCGRIEEARAALSRLRREAQGEPWTALRLAGLEGRIAGYPGGEAAGNEVR